jgi:hypothetical protein
MNRDPVRLLDDPSMPDLLREDLAEAANQPLPPVDMAVGLASLQASIRAGSVAAASGSGATVKAAALAHGSWWGGALIGLGAGLVGAAAIWLAPPLTRSPPPPDPPRIEVAAPLPIAAPAPPIPEPSTASAALPSALAPLPSARPALPAPSPSASSPSSPSNPEASASASPADGPAEELALLVRIKQKASSDPAVALALVDEGHRRFPRGSFYQERESIAVLALAQLGRATEARARAKLFLDAHPQSPYAERLRGLVPTTLP